MTLVLRSGVCRTPFAVEGATGTCNSVGCTDMGGFDMFFFRALAKIERAGVSGYELICWQLARREILGGGIGKWPHETFRPSSAKKL